MHGLLRGYSTVKRKAGRVRVGGVFLRKSRSQSGLAARLPGVTLHTHNIQE